MRSRNAALARMKLGCWEESQTNVNTHSHTTQHGSKTRNVSAAMLKFLTLLRLIMSCSLPAAATASHMQQHELEVDFHNRDQPTASPHHSTNTTRAAMHLRGGALSRQASCAAAAFGPCARLAGRNAPTSPCDAALTLPLQPSAPEPTLRLWRREGRACARAPRGRPPKLSRSVEVNTW